MKPLSQFIADNWRDCQTTQESSRQRKALKLAYRRLAADAKRVTQFAVRYLYQPAHCGSFSPWLVLTSSLISAEAAAELVTDWNNRDKGRRVWKFEECLPDSFDYPLRKRMEPLRKANCEIL